MANYSWGNTYTTNLNKIRSSQNACVKSIFFAPKRENVTPYYNLLKILRFSNMATIDLEIKLPTSVAIFRKKYTQFLLLSQV